MLQLNIINMYVLAVDDEIHAVIFGDDLLQGSSAHTGCSSVGHGGETSVISFSMLLTGDGVLLLIMMIGTTTKDGDMWSQGG
jgi:hypothetical protein